MSIFLYLARAISLVGCLVWPAHRQRTVARWKMSRPHKNVYEIGSGVIGLVILGALLFLLVQHIAAAWSNTEP